MVRFHRERSGRWWGAVVALAIAAMAIALTACGGGGSSSSEASEAETTTSAETGSETSAEAPSGSPIKIGVIATLTGPIASAGNAGGTVAPAWEEWVNEELGGINGHPVEVILKDEAGEAAKAQKVAKELVSEHVTAIVASTDYLLSAYSDEVIKAGIPVIGGQSNSPDWFEKAGLFPIVGHEGQVKGQVVIAHELGNAKSYANLYCAELPTCAETDKFQEPVAKELGIAFSSLAVKATEASYTAQCLSLKEKGVDYLSLNIAQATVKKMVPECTQQGYTPLIGSNGEGFGEEYLEIPGIKGYGAAEIFPTVAETEPVKEYRSIMEQFAKDENWRFGTAQYTWVGLELLHEVLEGISGEPTSTSVLEGLYEVKNNDLNGLVPDPVTYTKGKASSSSEFQCYFAFGFENGEQTAPKELEPICPKNS